MKVLLSIKPEFAEKIFDGTKKFEFRRALFKRENIKTVVVYASSPVRKVIGEFDIDSIIQMSPELLWEETKDYSGINKEYFFKYFENKSLGFAIKIKRVLKYKSPKCLKNDFQLSPPQSFLYI